MEKFIRLLTFFLFLGDFCTQEKAAQADTEAAGGVGQEQAEISVFTLLTQ